MSEHKDNTNVNDNDLTDTEDSEKNASKINSWS